MKQSLESQYNRNMDSLCFSREAKDAMAASLTARPAPRRSSGRRKLLALGVAAAILLTTMTGAAAYTRWSRSMNARYNATQERRELAESMGLSSMLEKEQPQTISATDQGITITAVQTIADPYRASITFRIEGFDLPQGAYPTLHGGVKSIGGERFFYSSMGGSFHDGTKMDENFKRVYMDGSPLKLDENGHVITHYVLPDGSLEYNIGIIFQEPGVWLGKEIEVHFSALGHETGILQDEIDVQGDWTLKWTLTGSDKTISGSPDAPIGDTGFILREYEITPLTISARLMIDDSYFEGWDRAEGFPTGISGVRMKDGSVCKMLMLGSEGYRDQVEPTALLEVQMLEILDVDQVAALLFHKDGTWQDGVYLETYYEVPVR